MLSTAVALADQGGIESLSMRKLAQALDVVPMALYRHVANKDELLDGLVDVVVEEIDPPLEGADWKTALRARNLSARRARPRTPGLLPMELPRPPLRSSSATWIR